MVARRRVDRAGLLVAVVTALVFAPSVGNEFSVWDDEPNIYRNEGMNPPKAEALGVYWDWSKPYLGLYVPLVYTTWWGLAKLTYLKDATDQGVHVDPRAYHAVNVVLHVAAAWVVWAILREILRLRGREEKESERGRWAAALGAMVFALHPIQAEPVNWATGLKDVMCGVWMLVGVWQYVVWAGEGSGFRVQGSGRSGGQWWRYVAATFAFVLALLSKPTAVVTPVIAGVLDWVVVGRPVKKVVMSVLPWVVLALPFVVMTKGAQPAAKVEKNVTAVPLWVRPLVAGDALAFYLGKVAWPVGLATDYGRTPSKILAVGWAFWTWAGVAAVAVVLWVKRREWAIVAAGGLVFVAGVLPVLGLVPFLYQYYSTVADRYVYVSMLGVGMAAGWAVWELWPRGKRVVRIAGGIVLVALAVLTIIQGRYWRDDLSLFGHAIEVNRHSFVAENNIGIALEAMGDEARGQRREDEAMRNYEEAAKHYRRSAETRPTFVLAMENRAIALSKIGRNDEAGEQIFSIISQDRDRDWPESMKSRLNEGMLRAALIQIRESHYPVAARFLSEILRRDPDNTEARAWLGAAREKMGGGATTRAASQGSR
jgi:hypothetical protein